MIDIKTKYPTPLVALIGFGFTFNLYKKYFSFNEIKNENFFGFYDNQFFIIILSSIILFKKYKINHDAFLFKN